VLAGPCQGHLWGARGQDWGEPRRAALPQAVCWALAFRLTSPSLAEQGLQHGLLWAVLSRSTTRPACPHPYLHFSEPRQTSGRSLPKASQTLPFSCAEVPGKVTSELGRPPCQQAVQCDHGVLARSPCQQAQDKPGPNSCQAQSLLMRRARARQERLCPQPQCGRGSGPTLLVGGHSCLTALWDQAGTIGVPSAPREGLGQSSAARRGPVKLGTLCGVLPIPALFPKAQDQFLHVAHLRGQVCHLLPQLFHHLGLLVQQSKQVPAGAGKADLVRELLSPFPEPPSSEMTRDTGAPACFSFPALGVLPFTASFSKRRSQRESHEPWALCMGAQTAAGCLPPPHQMSCRPGEGSYHTDSSSPADCSSST